MKRASRSLRAHRRGEQSVVAAGRPEGADLDSYFGPIRVEWDHEAAMTPLGQLPLFIDFLKSRFMPLTTNQENTRTTLLPIPCTYSKIYSVFELEERHIIHI